MLMSKDHVILPVEHFATYFFNQKKTQTGENEDLLHLGDTDISFAG